MNKLIKNYIYNILYQILVLIAPIMTTPYLARVLGANSLGVSNYVITIAGFFTTIGLLGIQNYGIREIAYVKQDAKKMESTFYELFLTRLLLCAVTLAVYVPYTFFSAYPILMWIASMYVVAVFIDPCWFYIGMEDMGKAVARNFLAKSLNVIGIFVLIKKVQDAEKYVFLLSFMTLVASLFAMQYLGAYFQLEKFKFNLDIKHVGRNIVKHIKSSLQLFWPQIATTVYLSVDKIMLEHLVSSSAVAYYDQAEKIVRIPLTFITVLSTVMMPRLASQFAYGSKEQVKAYLSKTIHFSLMLAFPMMLGIIGIISNLVPWYLGIDFLPVIQAVRFLSPIIVLCSLVGVSGDQYFTATQQTKIITTSYFLAAISNVVIDVCLIPQYGIVGAAIGTIAAYEVSLLIQYKVLLKEIDLKKDVINSISYMFKSIPMLIIVVTMSNRMPTRWSTTLIQIIAGVLVYGLVLLFSKDKFMRSFVEKSYCLLKHKLNIK